MKRKSLKEKTDRELIIMLTYAVSFYADPGTYFAIAFFSDPPCGDFANDFSGTIDMGIKPGKLARKVLGRTMIRELNRRWPILKK